MIESRRTYIVMALDYANIEEWTVDEAKQWAELHFSEETALKFEGESSRTKCLFFCYLWCYSTEVPYI